MNKINLNGPTGLQELKEVVAGPDFAKGFRAATIVFPGDGLGIHKQWVKIKGDRVSVHDSQMILTGYTRKAEPSLDQLVRDYLRETAQKLELPVKPDEIRVRGAFTSHAVVTKQVPSGANMVARLLGRHDGTGGCGEGVTIDCGQWPNRQRFEWHW